MEVLEMSKTLTPEMKAALAELLADDTDDDTDDDDTAAASAEEDADEFIYRGRRYVYTPDDIVEAEATVDQEDAAPVKKPAAKRPVRKKTPLPVAEPEPTTAPAPKRRFLT